jgi:hypothetical protein
MAKQTINIGTTPNDGTGDALRNAFDKTNSNFTELYDGKQNTLTLTTTGTSGAATLVGSTLNIPQYSGGASGLQGVHALVPLASGEQITASITSQALSVAVAIANRLYAYPFISAQSITTSNLYINVTTPVVSSLARILIYSDLNGLPNTKLYESANLDCSTSGIKTATTTFNFVAGTRYWLSLHSSSTQQLSSITASSMIVLKMSGSTSLPNHYFAAPTFGSAPTTFVITGSQTTTPPFIGITKA